MDAVNAEEITAFLQGNMSPSFAQTGEDLIVRFLLDRMRVSQPTYLDIGANHPVLLNNTMHFCLAGSRGINIEPNRNLWELLQKFRPRDINLNMGIGETAGELTYYEMSNHTANSFSREFAERMEQMGAAKIVRTSVVPVAPVWQILDQYSDAEGCPDFVNIDAEGIDEIVLRTFPFAQRQPKVICIETMSYDADGRWVKETGARAILEKQGYILYADTYINSIFVRHQMMPYLKGNG
ncbi:MAG: FkbM family methyltransferase [Planctomycetota bacterium]|jgi:FkbM family methyltransferase|nr:FkbM family methyltransferase [Planctomycetota bacterium]